MALQEYKEEAIVNDEGPAEIILCFSLTDEPLISAKYYD